MATPQLRFYITGQICVEAAATVLDENRFPSRQARLLFAYLVCQRAQPVPREELAEVLWPAGVPPAWNVALKSLVSKVRQFLRPLGAGSVTPAISNQFGCYQLRLPTGTWIDLETAYNSMDEAEGSIRLGDFHLAWGPANVALSIARRPFLSGEDGEWVDLKRKEINELLLRALDCYALISVRTGQGALATQMAAQAVSLDPYRETGHQRLMAAHASVGNRAEAVRVYHRCRELLAEELGIDPSPETEALYLDLLRSAEPV